MVGVVVLAVFMQVRWPVQYTSGAGVGVVVSDRFDPTADADANADAVTLPVSLAPVAVTVAGGMTSRVEATVE